MIVQRNEPLGGRQT